MPGPIFDIDHLHRRGRHQLLKGYWNIYEHSLVLVNVAQALAFFIAKLVFQSTSIPGYTPASIDNLLGAQTSIKR